MHVKTSGISLSKTNQVCGVDSFMLAILCLILCHFDQMFFFDTLTETFKDTIVMWFLMVALVAVNNTKKH